MAFDFSTLVTDRTQADVAYAKALLNKLVDGTATEEERAEWNSFTLKGTYNHTDLNRVTAAMDDLKARLESYGYNVHGYQRVKVPHVAPGYAPTSRLPEGYLELSHIESTGTQYIDTGFKANQNTSINVKFSTTQQSNGGLLVAMEKWQTKGYGIFVNAVIFGASVKLSNGLFGDGNTHDVALTSDAKCYDNGKLLWTGTVSTFTTPETLTICKSNVTSETHEFAKAKIYSCQIYDNGTLIRDYVPCINPSGDVGLFDIVTQQFYGNAGDGVFTPGNRVNVVLPSGYTRLTHIESTGTQYINTGINAIVGTKAIVGFQASATPTTNWWILSAVTSGSVLFRAGVNASTFRTDAGFAYNQTANLTSYTVATGTCSVNMTIPLYLFAQNEGGAVEFGKFKLYFCQLYNDGVLVRDYIPCIDTNGVVGLYDMVTASFFGNAGTGVFVAGALPRVLPDGYTQLEYIESSGLQCIDSGFKPNQDSRVVMDIQMTAVSSTQFAFCSRGGSSESYNNPFGVLFSSTTVRSDFGTSRVSLGDIGSTNRVTLDKNKTVCTVGGTSVTNVENKFQTIHNLILLASSEGGTPAYFAKAKLYSCQIYDNGTLIRDFVPCKNSGGVFGLYDILNDVFYQNAGSGTFTAGNEFASPSVAAVPVAIEVAVNETEYEQYTWYEFDCPTKETMALYLLNVSAIRSVIAVMKSTPSVPQYVSNFATQEANDIEKILGDIFKLLTNAEMAWYYSGDLFSGEV